MILVICKLLTTVKHKAKNGSGSFNTTTMQHYTTLPTTPTPQRAPSYIQHLAVQAKLLYRLNGGKLLLTIQRAITDLCKKKSKTTTIAYLLISQILLQCSTRINPVANRTFNGSRGGNLLIQF